MKPSNIGGQAVIEGIMMRNKDKYAVAVRKPNKEIEVDVQDYKSVIPFSGVQKVPFLRGIFAFVDSMVLGMKILSFSASFYDEEDTENINESDSKNSQNKELGDTMDMKSSTKEKDISDDSYKTEDKHQKKKPGIKVTESTGKILQALTMVLGIIIAVGIFMILPYFISSIFRAQISSRMLLVILEGIIRLGIFVGYILLISRMNDIKRTFMYHGAEHKCINCIENNLDLNVENVRESSKQHKRCGTSFLFFVMIVSIIFSFFITADAQILRVLIRLALLPLIAGVSYEIIKLAGSTNNPIINILSKPGMMVQNITTLEPDDSMIEVAIEAVEAVFDWKEFQTNETA